MVREETLRALAASWRELCGEFRVVVQEESFRLRWGQDRLSSSREMKTPKSMFCLTVPYILSVFRYASFQADGFPGGSLVAASFLFVDVCV